MQPILIIGIGNDYRSDDAVGLSVARALRARKLPDAAILEATGEGTALLDAWKGSEAVILIDAVTSGAPAGTLHQLDAHASPLAPDLFSLSTHAFGVAEAIELARVLDDLPARVMVYGIEGGTFAAGVGLSPEVESAVQQATAAIVRLIQSWQQAQG